MSAHTLRARMLIARSRFAEARAELGKAIAENESDPMPYCLMAFCLHKEHKQKESAAAIADALKRGPDESYAHYIHSMVLNGAGKPKQGLAAVDEAIRLEPDDAAYRGYKAALLHDLSRWGESLAAADEGLALDPTNVLCLNLRSMALIKLGRNAEAGESLHGTLARDPENALAHANEGWRRLHAGEYAGAMESFREALRLDPDYEYARQGMLQALHARHRTYRLYLRYILFMSRLSARGRVAFVLGAYFLYRIALTLSRDNPSAKPFATAVIAIYLLFVAATWLSRPIFNFLLLFHPFGRLVLSRDERIAATAFGGCAILGAGLLASGCLLPLGILSKELIIGGWLMLILAFLASLKTGVSSPRRRKFLFAICAIYTVIFGTLATAILSDHFSMTISIIGGFSLVAAGWTGFWLLERNRKA